MDNKVDIKENYIYQLDDKLLEILLKDRSSKKNIIWATDNYESRGIGFYFKDNILLKNITGRNGLVIKPRTKKSKKEQVKRIRDKAEVFTPSWVCNKQNNLVDTAWFGYNDVFNIEKDKTWVSTKEKIDFSKSNKTWKEYVSENRLEISCGEAPYLVSRYDTVTGDWIEIPERIGLLDRKLRVINENIDNEDDWYYWTLEAFKSIYGFEWQGDSVLIARENLLFTFIDYYSQLFNRMPENQKLEEVAQIISWNIWQMDGLKYVIPDSCKPDKKLQLTLFEEKEEVCQGCLNNNKQHIGIYCKIKNWETGRSIKFVSLLKNKA